MGYEEENFDLGGRIKRLRAMHNLSQRELAKRSGVSNGVISLIERNETSPSVGLLKRILDGVPMRMSDFFAMDDQDDEQVYFSKEELVEIAGGRISYRQVGRDLAGKAVQIIHETYAPGADTGKEPFRHESEEGGVVISGEIELTIGTQRRVLKEGEAYYFDSRQPHRFRNLSDQPAEVISACSPPSF